MRKITACLGLAKNKQLKICCSGQKCPDRAPVLQLEALKMHGEHCFHPSNNSQDIDLQVTINNCFIHEPVVGYD